MEIENQLTLMERYRLSVEEFFVINLLLIASLDRDVKPLSRYYFSPIEKSDLRSTLLNLQEKGVILKSYKVPQTGTKLDPEAIPFNELFMKNYRKASGELGQELFLAYPVSAVIQGVDTPLRNYAKKFNTEYDFFYYYGKSIGWNLTKHQEVLDLIQWSKDNGGFGLNMNIGDWVISKMWLSIKEYKESGRSTLAYDITQSI